MNHEAIQQRPNKSLQGTLTPLPPTPVPHLTAPCPPHDAGCGIIAGMVKQAVALALIGAGILAVGCSFVVGVLLVFNSADAQVVITDSLVPGGVGVMLIRSGLTWFHCQQATHQHQIDHSVTVEVD